MFQPAVNFNGADLSQPAERGIAWDYFALVILPLIVLLFSAVGLWLKKQWAFFLLIFIYLFQAYSYQDPEVSFLYYLGPHFFVEWTLNFSDGAVIQRFNLMAITVLVLLVLAFLPNKKDNQNKKIA